MTANALVQEASEMDDAVEAALQNSFQGSRKDAPSFEGSSGRRPDPSRLSDSQKKSREKMQRDNKQRAKAFQSGSSMLQRSMEAPALLGSSHGDSPRGGSGSSSGSSGRKHGRQAGVPTAAARKLLEAGSGRSTAAARERSGLEDPAGIASEQTRADQAGSSTEGGNCESPQLIRIRTQAHSSGVINERLMALPPSSLESGTPPDDLFASAMQKAHGVTVAPSRTDTTVMSGGVHTRTAGESSGGKKEQWVTVPTRVAKQEHQQDDEEGVVTGEQWATRARLPVGVQQLQAIREKAGAGRA